MGKKLFSVILSIVLCLSLSISAFAQEAGTTTTFAMEGKEYTLYVRDNVSVVTEVETGVRASFDNSTYILTIYENADAQPIVIQLSYASILWFLNLNADKLFLIKWKILYLTNYLSTHSAPYINLPRANISNNQFTYNRGCRKWHFIAEKYDISFIRRFLYG